MRFAFGRTGWCFESGTSSDTTLHLNDCKVAQGSSNSNQKWQFPTYTSSQFYVENYYSTKCVSTWDGSTNGTAVKVETIGTAPVLSRQRWSIPGVDGVPNFSVFKLLNAYTGRCLTTRQSGTAWQAREENCVSSGATNDAQLLTLDTLP